MEKKAEKIVRVKKLRSVDNPYHKDSWFGESAPFHEGVFQDEPKVGESFTILAIGMDNGKRGLYTSKVTKIVDENTFETLNSIYHWEIISDEPKS